MWYKPPLRASAAPDLAKNATLIPHPAAAFRRYRDYEIGAPDRIRTCDPKLRRLVLYPTELRARAKGAIARIAL